MKQLTYVVNQLYSYKNQTKLIKVDFIEKVNHTTISQLVVSTLNFYNIPFNNIIFLISDNAAYMKKAYNDILSPLIPQLLHNSCFAHIYNLVGETWQEFNAFGVVDFIVKRIKKSFVYSSARKRRWKEFLAINYIDEDTFPFDFESSSVPSSSSLLTPSPSSSSLSTPSPSSLSLSIPSPSSPSTAANTLPPLPVKTRWCSWFKFIFWLKKHIQTFKEFFIEEERIDNSSENIKELVSFFKKPDQVFHLEVILLFLEFNAPQYVYYKFCNK